MSVYRHILIPTDFSEAAEHALQRAAMLARQNTAELHLLHIIAPPVHNSEMPDMILAPMGDLNEQVKLAAEERLQKTAEQVGNDVVVHQHVRETFAHPADAISEVATETEIDLIVIGSHGHSGLMHILIGSTAEKIVRESSCDVLVVKPEKSA